MKTSSLSKKYDLGDKRVAVLSADGFEQSELMTPVDVLQSCGAKVDVISPDGGAIRAWEPTPQGVGSR